MGAGRAGVEKGLVCLSLLSVNSVNLAHRDPRHAPGEYNPSPAIHNTGTFKLDKVAWARV